jgi:glycosyltransferase involved in cell wall biosynthesis
MKICYFGTYNSNEGRNRIYIRGLQSAGVSVIECRTHKKGIFKYIDLIRKHARIKDEYDVLIVGYPGHVCVPLAKLISKKKIVFDALSTMYEGVVISRKEFSLWSFQALYIRMIDWLGVFCADTVLVETENQRKYFERKFGKNDKYKVLYTGADNTLFYKDEKIKKKEVFTVVFRGKFLPEAGVTHVIKAAKILEDKGVNFLILGHGWLEKEIKSEIISLGVSNLELIDRYVTDEELPDNMLSAHVSLGQFEKHERLSRTIPHKAFESLALGLPYITARSSGVEEILISGENSLFVDPADPDDLASKILLLKNDHALREKIARNGYELYIQKFTPEVLARELLQKIS